MIHFSEMKYLLSILLLSYQAFSLEFNELEHLFSSFHKLHSENLLMQFNTELHFNPPPQGFDESYWWEIDHASARFVLIDNANPQQLSIFVFGGLARLSGMTKDSMAISLCHELGHLLAGPPLKFSGSSVEGMADYFSTGDCLRKYFLSYENSSPRKSLPKEVLVCEKYYENTLDVNLCLRSFVALDGQLSLLRLVAPELEFWDKSTERPDTIRQDDYFYPEPSCRLESMRNGILGLPAPSCWLPK